jgi:hypothetical protein
MISNRQDLRYSLQKVLKERHEPCSKCKFAYKLRIKQRKHIPICSECSIDCAYPGGLLTKPTPNPLNISYTCCVCNAGFE